MIAKPIDEKILVDPRLPHRAPDLHDPAKHAQMLVDPIEGSADDLLGVVAEFVIDGDVRVARPISAFGADLLVMPQVFGVHFGIGQMIERAQKHAAPRVESHAARDVRMGDDELGNRAHFGFRCGERSGAELFVFLAPIGRKVSI